MLYKVNGLKKCAYGASQLEMGASFLIYEGMVGHAGCKCTCNIYKNIFTPKWTGLLMVCSAYNILCYLTATDHL